MARSLAEKPRLVVVYGQGAASPAQIIAAVGGIADIIFVADRLGPMSRLFAAINDIAEVVYDDGIDETARCLLRSQRHVLKGFGLRLAV
jgi:hypothetical protein